MTVKPRLHLTMFLCAVLTGVAPLVCAQSIFAHNDYVKPTPFFKAFELKATYIEADIFLDNGALVVAHAAAEIDPSKTLESMYLKPLSEKVKAGNGSLYGLTLMIDLKTEGTSTMTALVKVIGKFPDLIACEGLHFVVSGNYPRPSEWKNYPGYIWFDGRPNVDYTKDQTDRLKLISTSFAGVSKWNGNGEVPKKDSDRMKELIETAHKLGKPMRFWGAPDFENAWKTFIDIGLDVLNSDNIEDLSKFLEKRKG